MCGYNPNSMHRAREALKLESWTITTQWMALNASLGKISGRHCPPLSRRKQSHHRWQPLISWLTCLHRPGLLLSISSNVKDDRFQRSSSNPSLTEKETKGHRKGEFYSIQAAITKYLTDWIAINKHFISHSSGAWNVQNQGIGRLSV